MTYRTDDAAKGSRALRALVVIFIAWVAIWASMGGLAGLLADDAIGSTLHVTMI